MRFKLIISIVSYIMTLGGLMMFFPAIIDWIHENTQSAAIFALSGALTVGVGLIGWLLADTKHAPLKIKEMFFTTTLIWLAFTLICATPLYFSGMNISFIDAFFESVSGLTTTGATIFSNLETLPQGILLWRSMMQWMGGIGILVLAIMILPTLQIGGMQLFNIETSGESNRDMPTIAQNMSGILIYFVIITVLCGMCLWLAGMSPFDAFNHALTTAATGGFSTHDSSIAYFNSAAIEWILIFFMFIGGLPLMIGILICRKHFASIRDNEQIKLFCILCISIILPIVFVRWYHAAFDNDELEWILRTTAFDVISIVTSTGFIADNYETWGKYATGLFLFIMLTGGCTGSTTGGIKMFRYSILFKTISTKLKKSVQPHGVFIARYGHKPITDDVMSGVLVFLGLYALSACAGTIILSLNNLDFVTSFSGSISALSNVGPALGDIIGPDQTFAALPTMAKIVLAIMMIIGRLEFVAVYILLTPFFWKRNI